MYTSTKDQILKHLQSLCDPLRTRRDDTSFLKALTSAWLQFKLQVGMIRDLLPHVDKSYVTAENGLLSITKLSYEGFKNLILEDSKLSSVLKIVLHGQISESRLNGDGSGGVSNNTRLVESSLMRLSLRMLVEVQDYPFYQSFFENQFLADSASYYSDKAATYISENMDVPSYLSRINQIIEEERLRTIAYLQLSPPPATKHPNQHGYHHPISHPSHLPTQHQLGSGTVDTHPIQTVINESMLKPHLSKLLFDLPSNMKHLLDDSKNSDLSTLFILAKRVDGFIEMREVWRSHIEEKGIALVQSEEFAKSKNKSFVESLIALKDKYDDILQNAFVGNDNFVSYQNAAFKSVINRSQQSPEVLSLFLHEKIRKIPKEVSEEQFEKLVDKTLNFYPLLQEKDLFDNYYRNHLAKRLLTARASDDAERMMLTKFRRHADYAIALKLESMFNDVKNSELAMETFDSLVKEEVEQNLGTPNYSHPLANISLHVSVLTTGCWPSQRATECALPPQLQRCVDRYTAFYNSNHSARKLSWQYNAGTAVMKATFKASRKELQVPTPQMMILLLFNEQDTYTVMEIQQATSYPVNEIKRHLVSLTNEKQQILKSSNGENSAVALTSLNGAALEQANISYNATFKHQNARIVISMIAFKETAEEAEATRSQLNEQRKNELHAAIVRIMKSKKICTHNDLIQEVISQLARRFNPDIKAIKTAIEYLIGQEYMARVDGQQSTYEYKA